MQKKVSKFKKLLAIYLAMMILLETLQPMQMYALTSGPTQPEFNSFTPIGTSDMVDLTNGDFNYNIPIMDVGGYPLNLSYNSGITMDQEASWVGLGWNLNVGQIERQVRGLPDDFNGDEVLYENNLKKNITVGTNLGVNLAFAGTDSKLFTAGAGIGVEYNNYEGVSFRPSFGVGFNLSDEVGVGLNFTSSVTEGASVTPSLSISQKMTTQSSGVVNYIDGTGTIGLGFNSRKGLENLNLSASVKNKAYVANCESNHDTRIENKESIGGSISFNNQSFTPSKRIGFKNYSFSFNGAVGVEAWFLEPQFQMTGYGSYQEIDPEYKYRPEKAFGYEYTEHKKKQSGILDFNREYNRSVSENTTALPVTNYTYDTYNIEGQGVSGMFRPYRSKVSYVYNDAVVDRGIGISTGAEFGIGELLHWGFDFKATTTVSSTDGWFKNNNAIKHLEEKNTDKKAAGYEPVSFRLVGSMSVDPEINIYDGIQTTNPLRFGLGGVSKSRTVIPKYFNETSLTSNIPNQRTKRVLRNQLVHKITDEEAIRDSNFIIRNPNAKSHHTAGIKVVQNDGTTYVYGNTVYNTKKVEATFDVSGKTGNNTSGLVPYDADLTKNYSNNSDQYLNKITTTPYAHTYLLTSVLSTDYQDIDDNGPSINDLGSYTKFEYQIRNSTYKWRIPYEENMATYNRGLISKTDDEKGTYLYGEKELKYLTRIVTKTHVAFFDLDERKDARGVLGETGGIGAGSGKMYKIKSIRLYALPEVSNSSGTITDPGENGVVKPIKTAHFVYNYNLCKGMPNNDGTAVELTGDNAKGKLTLERVYFTYRGSKMGKYTPYVFDYGTNNPDYDLKGFDIWGNYKVNPEFSGNSEVSSSPLSTAEFAFVEQDVAKANLYTGAWTLKNVKLPSGGKISIETESDDYQYVQNKKAMQMFKVLGCGNQAVPPLTITSTLYGNGTQNKYLYVKLNNESSDLDRDTFVEKYLKENLDKPIQFRFLLNMTSKSWQKEYVSGYFKIKEDGQTNPITITERSEGTVVSIPLEFLKLDGGTNSNDNVNPIAKAGWGFGRTYLNRVVYSLGGDSVNDDFTSIVKDLVGSIKAITEIFNGPNKALKDKGCASNFDPNKSWIRLENPNGRKLGGGLRVKSIKLSDSWGKMLGNTGSEQSDPDTMEYGQTYTYNDASGKSSGVATFEPNSCSENPLVEPFYNNQGNYAENIAAPKENNYIEKPFGQNFFPAPRITYSRVLVKNLERKDEATQFKVKKHATGIVVTEHYTSYDFPTKVSYTKLDTKTDLVPNNILGAIIKTANVRVRNHLTMSQGYSIETNDMNGKIKSQYVYAESQADLLLQQNPASPAVPTSYVKYKYNIDADNNLVNNLTTINSAGEVETKLIGVDYDLVNDFNESHSETSLKGFDANMATVLFGIFPVFVPKVIPKLSYHENLLRTAVTTKHVHKTGILLEKTAYDLGSTISTKNIAWDADTGEVILTQTQNEYNDNYYSFTYPAYWMYDGMGMASKNIGIEGTLVANTPIEPACKYPSSIDPGYRLKDYTGPLISIFHVGDELCIKDGLTQTAENFPEKLPTVYKLWVIRVHNGGVLLMDRYGNYINPCAETPALNFKIVRSGYRNLQSAAMSTIITMTNPIANGNLNANSLIYSASSTVNPKILNANAIVYKDFWNIQKNIDFPSYPEKDPSLYITLNGPEGPYQVYNGPTYTDNDGNPTYPFKLNTNPYLWNIKGNWRAEKSYAYLAGRNSASANNPRNEGFFNSFSPFYQLTNGVWTAKTNNWTYASSVTKVSPYGEELENKDALERYSAAQYGYQHKLPMAVASNSKYQQMGFEGFEEIKSWKFDKHFGFNTIPPDFVSTESHTGKGSLKVLNGQTKSLTRKLSATYKSYKYLSCAVNPIIQYCPTSYTLGNANYPGTDMNGMYVSKFTFKCAGDIRQSNSQGNTPAYLVKVIDNNLYVGFNATQFNQRLSTNQSFYITISFYVDGVPTTNIRVGNKITGGGSGLAYDCKLNNDSLPW
ncbi:hypothetical protein [Flavobacterium hydrophilum]|nr:hypothetical protein [Flavobacterium hydrophilum]